VWEINTIPHSESHFAIFPNTLIETPIKACCPEFVCKKCGMPREKIIEINVPKMGTDLPVCKTKTKIVSINKLSKNSAFRISGGDKWVKWKTKHPDKFKGYTDCGCNAGYRHGITLDPFSGIGTTIETAFKLGRDGLGFDISEKYCKMANKNLSNSCSFKRLTDFIGE